MVYHNDGFDFIMIFGMQLPNLKTNIPAYF